MTRSSRLVLAALLLAASPGPGIGAPVALSAGQDAALRQLITESDTATATKQGAGGNPFLAKKPRKPAASPAPAAAAAGAGAEQPIDLLAHGAAATAATAAATPPLADAKPAAAKVAKKTGAPAATPAKPVKVVAVPLPRLRPVTAPADPAPDVAPVNPTPAVAAAKPVPAVAEAAPEAATPAPYPEPVQPAHPPSASAAALPADADRSVDLAAAPLPADAPPYRLVRSLQFLQDQTAQGSAAAFVAERQLRARLDEAFIKSDAKVWQDPLNAAAAVTFVLSGGSPNVLRHIAGLAPPPAVDNNLIDGAVAYIEGRVVDATKALGSVDPNTLPASMAGQMALAQAALSVATNPETSMQFLDTARLLAPGTLVEEAALRREIMVADELEDEEKFESLSRQYLTRFRHSVYAGNFRFRFATILTHLKFADEAEQAKTLDDMFRDLDPDTSRELYLTVARAALIQGKAKTATFAAERAAATSAEGSADMSRAHLYRAAGLAILPDGIDNAITEAQAIRPDLLKPSDRLLKEAADLTIQAIAKADKVADRTGGDPAVPKGVAPSPPMIRAETALQAADALLAEANR